MTNDNKAAGFNNDALSALTPLDGRYREAAKPLGDYFSEAALIRHRVLIELQWLKTLRPLLLPKVQVSDDAIDNIAAAVTPKAVKQTEQQTRHDLKAAEVCIAAQLQKHNLGELLPLLHFACTSWDINNLAQTIMLRDAVVEVMLPQLGVVTAAVDNKAKQYAAIPMLSRTHGQPASPTTLGKEFANFAVRMDGRKKQIQTAINKLPGKINGATGNYNAHYAAYPDINWQQISRAMVEKLGLKFASHTTQIEPYDNIADLFNAIRSANNVLMDLCRDLWGYIAMDYFSLPAVAGEVGSSAMPHKVNPIDFENAEGNIGLSNTILSHLSDKLPVSRWQRDLSDSTAGRATGAALGHSLIAWKALEKGLGKLAPREDKLAADLENNWQVLAEAAVIIMRAEGIPDGYDIAKKAMHGKTADKKTMQKFFATLPISIDGKQRLMKLTPATYTGIAESLAKTALDNNDNNDN